jgi:dipeptidase E
VDIFMESNIILTSSFNSVAKELLEKAVIPNAASVAFIPTAGDPYPEKPWIDADRNTLVGLRYNVTDFDLKQKSKSELQNDLKNFDVIFFAGGNTTYLAHYAHLSNFSVVVRDLLQQGKVYIGSSAGSILAGPTVEPFLKEDASELPTDFVVSHKDCLGLVDYVVLPHDNVSAFSSEHDKIIEQYKNRFSFVRLKDNEYRLENI